MPVSILDEAKAIIAERGKQYGGIEENFDRAAKLASLKLDRAVTPYEVLIVLESVKDARRAADPTHRDSHIDGINYRAFAAVFALYRPEDAPARYKFVFFRMEAEGISRKQFALAAGVTEKTLSNYASGYREPKIDILERMLHIVGYDLCALQEGTGARDDITGSRTS